jgi:hypothetical protein
MAEKKNSKQTTKKSTKVNSTKKTTVKKNTSDSKSVQKKTNKKKKIDSLIILKTIFYLLIVLVIFLSVLTVVKKNEHKNDVSANIVIPIVDKEDEAPFSVNLRALSEAKEYVFKVTNYQDNKINNTDINYYIDVLNETDSKVTITKYGSDEDLLKGESSVTLDGGKVPKG